MTDGFVKLPRMLMTYPELKPHDAFYVLYMILSLMRFHETYMDGVLVEKNQLLISKPELAERCNVNISRLKYILSVFEEAGGIKTENNGNKNTKITVLDRYLTENTASDVAQKKKQGRKAFPKTVGNIPQCAKSNETAAAVYKETDVPCEKNAYGVNRNVLLTDEEYADLCTHTDRRQPYINKLSAYLANHPEKNYANHYNTLIEWISDDQVKGRNGAGDAAKDTSNNFPECFKTPSYDIARIEERIRRNGPGPIKKRQR